MNVSGNQAGHKGKWSNVILSKQNAVEPLEKDGDLLEVEDTKHLDIEVLGKNMLYKVLGLLAQFCRHRGQSYQNFGDFSS